MKYEDLDLEQRLLVLEWALDGIDSGMKKMIQDRSHATFVACLHGKKAEFSIEDIWSNLPESTREHFNHASSIVLDLKAQIDELVDEIDSEDDDQPLMSKPAQIDPEVLQNDDRT